MQTCAPEPSVILHPASHGLMLPPGGNSGQPRGPGGAGWEGEAGRGKCGPGRQGSEE